MAVSAGNAGMVSAGISQASGLAGALSQIGGYKRAEKSTERLSEWNYLNSPRLEKQGMKDAGLSTSGFGQMGNESGTPASQPQPRDMSSAFGNLQQGFGNMSNQFLAIAQVRKANAEAENQEIKNAFEEQRQAAEVGTLQMQLAKLSATFDSEVDNWKLQNQSLLSDINKNSKQAELFNQEIQNLKVACQGLSIDNEYKAKNWEAEIDKLRAEFSNLIVNTRLAPMLAHSTIGLQTSQTGYYSELSHLTSSQRVGQDISNEYNPINFRLDMFRKRIENFSSSLEVLNQERTGIRGSGNMFSTFINFGAQLGRNLSNSISLPAPLKKEFDWLWDFYKSNGR